jgi:hypothetical protein
MEAEVWQEVLRMLHTMCFLTQQSVLLDIWQTGVVTVTNTNECA